MNLRKTPKLYNRFALLAIVLKVFWGLSHQTAYSIPLNKLGLPIALYLASLNSMPTSDGFQLAAQNLASVSRSPAGVAILSSTDGNIELSNAHPASPILSHSRWDEIEMLGFALQGNGGNYASTLSAVAESLEIAAEDAIQLQGQGIQKGFLFPSFVGASSGSLVVSIASSLIQNTHLFPDSHTDKVFSPSEVKTLSRALRYMAYAADERLFERFMFIAKSGISMVKGKLGLDRLSYEFKRMLNPKETPNWWTKSISRSEAVLYDFTKAIFIAQNLNKSMLLVPPSDLSLSPEEEKLVTELGWMHVSDLPRIPKDTSNPKGALKLAAKVAKYVRVSAEKRVRKALLKKYRIPFLRHAFVNYDNPTRDTEHPLKKAMIDHKLADGCVTATFVLWKEEFNLDDVDKLPKYLDEDVRPMLFANAETAHVLAQYYNNTHISEHEKDALIASTPHIHGGMLPSTKEPDLLEVLAGHANNPAKYSISSIKDLSNGDDFTVLDSEEDQGPWIGTLGGFINAASLARIASLQLSIKARDLQNKLAQGTQISSKLLIFSKPSLPGLEDFAQQKIKQLFSGGDSKLAEENIEIVKLHAQNNIDRTIYHGQLMEQLGINSEMNRLGVYWDISGTLPAAQAGKSYLLVYLIANEVRKQLDEENQMTFNPLSEEEENLFTTETGTTYDLYGRPVSDELFESH